MTSSDKNQSAIDKTIANLIKSNKLNNLGSPPHGSFKRVCFFFIHSYIAHLHLWKRKKRIYKCLLSIFKAAHVEGGDSLYGDFDKKRPKKDKQSLLLNIANTSTQKLNANADVHKLKSQSLLKQHLHHQQQQQQQQTMNQISSKNHKLTVNSLTQQQHQQQQQRRLVRTHQHQRPNQQLTRPSHMNTTLLSNRDDLYDSENNETPAPKATFDSNNSMTSTTPTPTRHGYLNTFILGLKFTLPEGC